MRTYGEYRPTSFDPSGLGLPDRQDWIVAPVGQNRDSGCLERSNWRIVLGTLTDADPDGEDHEDHRFGHWACGWFEIIIARPGSRCADILEDWERALADYPVADEMDWSMLQSDEASEYWERMGLSERIEICDRFDVSIFAARRDEIPRDDTGALEDYLTED